MAAGAIVETATLGAWLGSVPFTPPTSVYVALLDQTYTELTGGGYLRVPLTNTSVSWSAPSGSVPASVSNVVAVTFPTSTSTWNTAIWFALYDDPTAGNLLFQGTLLTPFSILGGQTANFPAGSLVVQAN